MFYIHACKAWMSCRWSCFETSAAHKGAEDNVSGSLLVPADSLSMKILQTPILTFEHLLTAGRRLRLPEYPPCSLLIFNGTWMLPGGSNYLHKSHHAHLKVLKTLRRSITFSLCPAALNAPNEESSGHASRSSYLRQYRGYNSKIWMQYFGRHVKRSSLCIKIIFLLDVAELTIIL